MSESSKIISFRLPFDEYIDVLEKAEKAKMTMSDYMLAKVYIALKDQPQEFSKGGNIIINDDLIESYVKKNGGYYYKKETWEIVKPGFKKTAEDKDELKEMVKVLLNAITGCDLKPFNSKIAEIKQKFDRMK